MWSGFFGSLSVQHQHGSGFFEPLELDDEEELESDDEDELLVELSEVELSDVELFEPELSEVELSETDESETELSLELSLDDSDTELSLELSEEDWETELSEADESELDGSGSDDVLESSGGRSELLEFDESDIGYGTVRFAV